jgi:hypothetical protein
MENFNNILNSLNELNKIQEIFVPSQNRSIKFNGLTAKQQKEALQCIMDKDFSGLSFSILASEILTNNITEKVPLLLSDKNYLLICLRAFSLSLTYKNSSNETYDLTSILNNKIPLPADLRSTLITEGDISVTTEIPNLEYDAFISKESKKKLETASPSQTITKESIGELYIDEILKYVKLVKTSKAEIKSEELTYNQKYRVIEALPISITSRIIEFINKVKEFERSITAINGTTQIVSVDPALFTL